MNQYITRTGQNTGTSKTASQLHTKAMAMARVAQYQNLNSGSRRMKGRNSSSFLTGSPPADPSSMSWSAASSTGSNLGERNARKRLRR